MKNFNNIYTNTEIKQIFESHNAFDKSHTINKSTLYRELENLPNGKNAFNKLVLHQVIHKHNNRYYFSEECEKNKKLRKSLISVKLLLFILLIIFSITAIILIFQSSNSNQSEIISNTTVTDINFNNTTYDLADFNMQIKVPTNMNIVTGDSLDYLIGEGSSSFYEFAIYNNESSLTCFIEDTTIDMVDKYWNNINDVYISDSDYSIISEKKEETISGFKFTTFEATSNDYKELFLGFYKNNKFISFQYTYPVSYDGRKVLSEIIKTLN